MKIPLYDLSGEKTSDVEIKINADIEFSGNQSLLRYMKVFLANQHQGTSSTKTRAEVSGGGKKPHPQKHTGRARAGSIRSPLWVGGGVIHGPKPKNVGLSLPKEFKRQAFSYAVSIKLKNNAICAIDFTNLNSPSSKSISNIINKVTEKKKTLFIHDSNDAIVLSARNVALSDVKDVSNVNAYDFIKAKRIVIDKDVISKLEERI